MGVERKLRVGRGFGRGAGRVTMETLLTALNGRPGACQGVGVEGWVKQGDG